MTGGNANGVGVGVLLDAAVVVAILLEGPPRAEVLEGVAEQIVMVTKPTGSTVARY